MKREETKRRVVTISVAACLTMRLTCTVVGVPYSNSLTRISQGGSRKCHMRGAEHIEQSDIILNCFAIHETHTHTLYYIILYYIILYYIILYYIILYYIILYYIIILYLYYIIHWRRKRGGKGGMSPPTFLIGGATFNPTFLFST